MVAVQRGTLISNRLTLTILLMTAMFAFSGCASIIEGTTQEVKISTTPSGARCDVLKEGIVIGQVASTPGGVLLKRTKHDLVVKCMKDGCEPSEYYLKSGTSGGTFGNILLGGGIGWAVDSAAGADNEYPEFANIALACAASKK